MIQMIFILYLIYFVIAENGIEYNNSTKTLTLNSNDKLKKIEIRKYLNQNSINENDIEYIHLGKDVIFNKHLFDSFEDVKDIEINEENELYTMKDNIVC